MHAVTKILHHRFNGPITALRNVFECASQFLPITRKNAYCLQAEIGITKSQSLALFAGQIEIGFDGVE